MVDAPRAHELHPLRVEERGVDDRGADRQLQLEREATVHAGLRVEVPLEQTHVEHVLGGLLGEREIGLSLIGADHVRRVHVRAHHREPHAEAALVHRTLIRCRTSTREVGVASARSTRGGAGERRGSGGEAERHGQHDALATHLDLASSIAASSSSSRRPEIEATFLPLRPNTIT